MKKIINICLTILVLAIGMSSCEDKKNPNLYVYVDEYAPAEYIYICEENASIYDSSSKNILGKELGTYTLNGVTYKAYHMPVGIYDVVIKFYYNSSYDTVERYTVNTKENSWVRIYMNTMVQDSGELY